MANRNRETPDIVVTDVVGMVIVVAIVAVIAVAVLSVVADYLGTTQDSGTAATTVAPAVE